MMSVDELKIFVEEVADTYARVEEEESAQSSFDFMMAKKILQDMLFRVDRTQEEPLPPVTLKKKKGERQIERMKGLRAFLKREQERAEVTKLSYVRNNLERYQLITRLKTLSAIQPEGHWARRRLEHLIDRIEKGDVEETQN